MGVKIPVLYGTETGNAEYCADELAEALTQAGFTAEAVDMEDFSPTDLPVYPVAFVVTSTYGNGDPPASAETLLRELQEGEMRLTRLNYAVCGLGDSSFAHFAQCGKDFDRALSECGARAMFERVDCDADYDVPFERFKESALGHLRANSTLLSGMSPVADSVDPPTSGGDTAETDGAREVTRDRPFQATMTKKRLLSQAGSLKETMHYEFDLEGSGIQYRAGDCFGIHPNNSNRAIDEVLQAVGLEGSESVICEGAPMSLRDALVRMCLQSVGVEFVKRLAAMPWAKGSPAAVALEGGDLTLSTFIREHHVVDALRSQSVSGLDATTFLGLLRKAQPRLYSVASSPRKDPNRVALTVETLRYQWNERYVEGVTTCWLADHVEEGATVPMYLVANDDFQFPAEPKPVVMVGPGTGIAPFRAYLEELEATGRNIDTWLFFGHQHEENDFLYEEEIRRWESSGVLSRASFAWSRDQECKVYVQHRIAEHGAELWSWLQRGAVVFVCGDAKGMAPSVAEAFAQIATVHGGVEDGEAWLQGLRAEGRYKADVY